MRMGAHLKAVRDDGSCDELVLGDVVLELSEHLRGERDGQRDLIADVSLRGPWQ